MLRALLDLDGTMADYDSAFMRDLEPLSSKEEWLQIKDLVQKRESLPRHIEARRQLITRIPGWWRNLPKVKSGFEIMEVIREYGFTFEVLSQGPVNKPRAWSEKVEWCAEHLPDVPITITRNKSAHYGKILVDDWPQFMDEWLKSRQRGLGIMVSCPWNKDYLHPNVIIYHGPEDIPLLRTAIKAVKDREDGAPLWFDR